MRVTIPVGRAFWLTFRLAFLGRRSDGCDRYSSEAVREMRIEAMLFHRTPEDHIRTCDEQRRTEPDGGHSSFASEQELQELASQWPMKRLVEIWNRLPGVEQVIRFTDRKTAIAR